MLPPTRVPVVPAGWMCVMPPPPLPSYFIPLSFLHASPSPAESTVMRRGLALRPVGSAINVHTLYTICSRPHIYSTSGAQQRIPDCCTPGQRLAKVLQRCHTDGTLLVRPRSIRQWLLPHLATSSTPLQYSRCPFSRSHLSRLRRLWKSTTRSRAAERSIDPRERKGIGMYASMARINWCAMKACERQSMQAS